MLYSYSLKGRRDQNEDQHFMFDNNKPFFIGRLSGNETNICGKLLYNKNISQNLLYEMLTAAGIQFLNNDDVKNYVDMYIKSCQNSSLLDPTNMTKAD